jgi:two-component system LytT family sensor kinase
MKELTAPASPPDWRITSREWLWVVSIISALGVFDGSQHVILMQAQDMHHAWSRVFIFRFLYWLPWAVVTPWVTRLGRLYPPKRSQRWHVWCLHGAACAAIGAGGALWTGALEHFMNPWQSTSTPEPWNTLWLAHFFSGLLSDVVIYGTILAIGFGLDSRERLIKQQANNALLNELLVKAQLDALRRQIEPHFLFNTLNAVTGLMRERRNDAAIDMIAGLSDLLRRVLDDADRSFVALGEELAFLDIYLAIQKVRFGERLRISIAAPDALLSARLPGLILQPIVENAFQHGLAHRTNGGALRLGATTDNGMLVICIYNDGPALPPQASTAPGGIGLTNVRERLKALYADQFTLSLCDKDDGVEVRIAIPYAVI